MPANHGLAEEALVLPSRSGARRRRSPSARPSRCSSKSARRSSNSVPETLDDVRGQIREVAAPRRAGARRNARRGYRSCVWRGSRSIRAAAAPRDHPAAERLHCRSGIAGRRTSGARGMTISPPARYRRLSANSAGRLALLDADVLIRRQRRLRDAPSLATEALRHPIVAELARRLKVVSLPSRLWTCAGPAFVDAVERLVDATKAPRAAGRAIERRVCYARRGVAPIGGSPPRSPAWRSSLTFASLVVGYVHLDALRGAERRRARRASLPALVLVELRLPRARSAAPSDSASGSTGAAMQGLLRNPLADPGVVGVSGGAALGAVVVFYSGLAGAFSLALPLGGIAGAVVAALSLRPGRAGRRHDDADPRRRDDQQFRRRADRARAQSSPNPYAAFEIMFWLMGSLVDRSLPQVWLALPLMLARLGAAVSSAPALDALSLARTPRPASASTLRPCG